MFNGGSSSSMTIYPIDKKIGLRAFHAAENECPTICQTAKVVSTKLLLQTLYGTTLTIVTRI